MSVHETVAAIVRGIRAARQPVQGEWDNQNGRLIAWLDEHADERIIITGHITGSLHTASEWVTHPAVMLLASGERARYVVPPDIALASWVLDDGALDAMLAAGVDADYARDASRAGVTDAWAIIDGWEAGIPVEFLGAVGGGA